MCLNLKHYTFKIRRHSYSSTCMNHMVTTNQKPTRGTHKLERKELKHTAKKKKIIKPQVQFNSVTHSCLTLCDPMNCSMPGLLVHHQPQSLPKPMSIESVMPSNHLILCRPLLLLPPIPPSIRVFSNESALCISGQSIGVSASTSVLPMNTQDRSLGWTGWISLLSKGLSRVFSNTTAQKHQFFGAQLFL